MCIRDRTTTVRSFDTPGDGIGNEKRWNPCKYTFGGT